MPKNLGEGYMSQNQPCRVAFWLSFSMRMKDVVSYAGRSVNEVFLGYWGVCNSKVLCVFSSVPE